MTGNKDTNEASEHTHQITEYPKSKLINNYDSFISNLGKVATRMQRGGRIKRVWRSDIWQDLNHILSAFIMGNMDDSIDTTYLQRFLHEDKRLLNPCTPEENEYEHFDVMDDLEYYHALVQVRKQLDFDVKKLNVVNIYPQSKRQFEDIEEKIKQ